MTFDKERQDIINALQNPGLTPEERDGIKTLGLPFLYGSRKPINELTVEAQKARLEQLKTAMAECGESQGIPIVDLGMGPKPPMRDFLGYPTYKQNSGNTMTFTEIVAELDSIVNQLYEVQEDDLGTIRQLRRRIGMCLRKLNELDPNYVKGYKKRN